MIEMPRLVDDPDTPREVREGLREVADAAVPYDEEAGLRRLQMALAAGGMAAAAGTAATHATGAVSKLWMAVGLVGAVAGGGVVAHLVWGGASTAASGGGAAFDETSEVAAPEAPVIPPSTVVEDPGEPPPGDSAAPPLEGSSPSMNTASMNTVERAEANGRRRARPVRSARERATEPNGDAPIGLEPVHRSGTQPAPVTTSDALREETVHLARVRSALERSPAEALRLAREGQRRFPAGVFEEERRALIVMALERSGQREEARRAARAFVDRYPSGPVTERIRQISDPR